MKCFFKTAWLVFSRRHGRSRFGHSFKWPKHTFQISHASTQMTRPRAPLGIPRAVLSSGARLSGPQSVSLSLCNGAIGHTGRPRDACSPKITASAKGDKKTAIFFLPIAHHCAWPMSWSLWLKEENCSSACRHVVDQLGKQRKLPRAAASAGDLPERRAFAWYWGDKPEIGI